MAIPMTRPWRNLSHENTAQGTIYKHVWWRIEPLQWHTAKQLCLEQGLLLFQRISDKVQHGTIFMEKFVLMAIIQGTAKETV